VISTSFFEPEADRWPPVKCVKVVGQEFVEHFQVCAEIRRDVESLERCIARSHAIHGHHEFGRRHVNKEISLNRMVEVTRQLNALASERKGLVVTEDHIWDPTVRIVLSFKSAAMPSTATIFRSLRSLNAGEPPMWSLCACE
jgi:hypothetical protein